MRALNKNKQKMYYALKTEVEVPIYDYYTDEEGNVFPIDSGDRRFIYDEPVEFEANVSFGGGNVAFAPYGLNLGEYEVLMSVGINTIPIDEASLIWLNTKPQRHADGTIDENSAEYRVAKVIPSLNEAVYALKKVVK